MLRLLMYAAGGWALYRAGQASVLGVSIAAALLSPLTPISVLATALPAGAPKLKVM